MCLITLNPTVHIAEKDMIVYKQGIKNGKNKFDSLYYEFTYNIGTLYECEIEEGTLTKFDTVACIYYDKHRLLDLHSFGKGFHSAFNKERFVDKDLEFWPIGKFIVPKGSKYIKDETGLLVSNKIIFKGWI